MSILAFDACQGALSVAVRWQTLSGAWEIVSAHEARQSGHAEHLIPMIRDVVARSPLALKSIARIAVTLGPGTFTGVRTGVAAARALALATGAEVVGMTSLAAVHLAALEQVGAAAERRPIAIALDARKGEVYFQASDASGHFPAGDISLVSARAAAARLGSSDWLIAGSGAELVAAEVRAAGRPIEIVRPQRQPDARLIAIAAPTLARLATVEPIYVRPPDAKPSAGAALPRLGDAS